jgi:hypothetical protein
MRKERNPSKYRERKKEKKKVLGTDYRKRQRRKFHGKKISKFKKMMQD